MRGRIRVFPLVFPRNPICGFRALRYNETVLNLDKSSYRVRSHLSSWTLEPLTLFFIH